MHDGPFGVRPLVPNSGHDASNRVARGGAVFGGAMRKSKKMNAKGVSI
jgi:hypothetical protein